MCHSNKDQQNGNIEHNIEQHHICRYLKACEIELNMRRFEKLNRGKICGNDKLT